MPSLKILWRAFLDNPWVLLSLAVFFWSGNIVAARLAVGELSPMATVALRWAIVSTIFLVFARRQFIQDWPVLRPRWFTVAWMGALAFTVYNALYYTAAHYTSGVHIAIFQGMSPVFVFIGAKLAFGTPIGPFKTVGLLMTLLGIVVVATNGNLLALGDIGFNGGDLFLVVATVFYAVYVVALPNRPKVSTLSFFAALSFVAFLTSLPLLGFEAASGNLIWPTLKGWLIVVYISLFPSLIAQILFIRAVELVGPGRAGHFYNLTPVVGATLVVIFLHEPLALYQIVALALVVGGIFVAEKGPQRLA